MLLLSKCLVLLVLNSGNNRDHYQHLVLWVFFKIPTLEYFIGEFDKFMW